VEGLIDQAADILGPSARRQPEILPARRQAALITEMVRERLDTILPRAMQAADLDVWLILCQEDDPDPLFKTMIPMDTWSPILSMLVFVRDGASVRRYNICGTNTKDLFERLYEGQIEEKQWPRLVELLQARDPARIGINTGSVAWSGGGLTQFLYRELLEKLPEKFHDRLVSAEAAAVQWASTLTETEKTLFSRVSALGQYMISACFNESVVTPGVTTVDDLVWHYWQHSRDLGLDLAFRPFFSIRRDQRETRYAKDVISPGDVVHCDVGIKYLRLNSDHQHLAYVPRIGETDVPAGLKARMADTNLLQDIYMAGFHHGASGNEMLSEMRAKALAAGLREPRIYSHNLGLFLHQPGPLIGLPWEQVDTGPRGNVRLEYDSAFVMELSTDGPVPEWGGQILRTEMEEPVIFTREGCRTLCGRQTEFHVI
jgi:hypothetical protein